MRSAQGIPIIEFLECPDHVDIAHIEFIGKPNCFGFNFGDQTFDKTAPIDIGYSECRSSARAVAADMSGAEIAAAITTAG